MGQQSRQGYPWASLSDRALSKVRLCDLGLKVEGSLLEPAVEQLHSELRERGIRLRPHVWLADEWFTPDGVPGIAAPFYLAHRRLRELEQSQMLEVEGGTHDWCMRILRHEAGHAIDNAHRLHRRRKYRQMFGSWHEPYPDSYRPRPNTKRYVVHLDLWYAQAHPAEDFAETFAVWLNPKSDWRRQYATWPAMKKLLYVDELTGEVGPAKAVVRSRRRTHTLATQRQTLGEFYEKRRNSCRKDSPGFYDRDLHRIFSSRNGRVAKGSAAAFLESIRGEARMMISRWTGVPQLTIDRSLADMIKRAGLLRLPKPPRAAKVDVMMMLVVQTMNYFNDGKHRVAL